MPGLLDLPPELIEQIFDKCEETGYEEWCAENDEEDYWPPRAGVPAFRSTCRYIGRATCRRFAEVYLRDGHWEIAAKHAEIEKFCAQARVNEFAASKKVLLFGLDDDISAKASLELKTPQPIDGAQSSSSATTHRFDEATGALVPFHLYRNRDAIVEAFRACKRLTEIRFSKNWGDGDRYHTGLRCALAAGEDDDDLNQPVLFDITSSVAYVLSLAEEAGTCLERIFVSDVWPDVRVGLSDGASLVRYKGVFRNLKSLGLKLIEDPTANLQEVGSCLGKQMSEAVAHMPVLQALNLHFAPAISIAAWSQIANGSATTMSNLKELNLEDCRIDMCDFSTMLSNIKSLKRLFITAVHLQKGFRDDLAQTFFGLADGPCELETFSLGIGGLFMGEVEEIIFPSSLYKHDVIPFDSEEEIEGEEEWIEVVIQPWIH